MAGGEEGEAVEARGVFGFAVTPLLCRGVGPKEGETAVKAGGERACPLSDEADMERAFASCGTLCGVARRQNGSVAGLVLAEVRSCPGLRFLFVRRVVGEPFSQPRMWHALSSQLRALGLRGPCGPTCLRGLSLSCGVPGPHLSRGHGLCHLLGTL